MASQALAVVEQTFKTRETVNKITMALGFRSDDENGKQKAYSFIASVLAEIEKSTLDPKKDLSGCEPMSLVQCAIDAAQMEIAIDARQHGHIVKEQGRAVLRIGFRGFVSKITEHYPDADIRAELIWNGDELSLSSEDGFDHYKIERKSSLVEPTPANLKGVLIVMAYTKGGRQYQKCETLTAAEVAQIRKKAKFDGVWSEWFGEKAKVAGIKRATKTVFAGITGLQQLIRYDNAKNFQPLKAADAPKAGSLVENLNAAIQPTPQPKKTEPVAICGTCGGTGVVEDAEGKGPCTDCQEVKQ